MCDFRFIINVKDCHFVRLIAEMIETNQVNKYQKKIVTIPNVLSLVRLCLVPVIVWLFTRGLYVQTGIVLIISCITDMVDGTIARKFNMISDVGKVLDPAADKTTQLVIMILLCFKFPLMIVPIICTAIKESFMVISGYFVVKRSGIVLGANWHGKAATTVVASVMLLHLLWPDIYPTVSAILIFASAASILISLALYAVRNFGYLSGKIQE